MLYTTTNSKWTINVNTRAKIITLLEGNMTETPWAFSRQRCSRPCAPAPSSDSQNDAQHPMLALTVAGFNGHATLGFPSGSDDKESACKAGDLGFIPGSGRSPKEGKGYPLQYSCLENPMDRGAWRATYSPWGLKESDTTERLSTHKNASHPLWTANRVRIMNDVFFIITTLGPQSLAP